MKTIIFCLVAATALLQFSCKQSAPAAPETLPTEITGVWKLTMTISLPDRAYENGFGLQYAVLKSDSSCDLYYTSGLGFNARLAGKYTCNATQLNVASESFPQFTMSYNPVAGTLDAFGASFARSTDTSALRDWADSTALAPLVVIPDPSQTLTNRYYGLAFDGSSFYTIAHGNILRFSGTGGSYQEFPLRIPDSLDPGAPFFLTSIAYGDGVLWVPGYNAHYEQYVFKFLPSDGSLIQAIHNQGNHRIFALAKSMTAPLLWALADHSGEKWLHTLDAETGRDVDSSFRVDREPDALGWSNYNLWGTRMVGSSLLYAEEFNPQTGRGVSSVRLALWANADSVAFYTGVKGIVHVNNQLYVLDGYHHVLYHGVIVHD